MRCKNILRRQILEFYRTQHLKQNIRRPQFIRPWAGEPRRLAVPLLYFRLCRLCFIGVAGSITTLQATSYDDKDTAEPGSLHVESIVPGTSYMGLFQGISDLGTY
jgi:hypothetical protein